MSPPIQSFWWSFTLNSKTSPQDILVLPEDLPSYDTLVSFFESSDLVRFCQFSHEYESRHHLQGVFQLKKKSSLKGVKNCLPSPWCDFVHCEPLKLLKNDNRKYEQMIDDCIAYTEKEETHVSGPYVYGLRVKKGSNSGKVADACKRSPDRMQLESPKEFRRFVAKESVDDFNEKFEFNHELRPWQIELEKLLVLPADDRMVIWVFGEKGNEGKSTYAKKVILSPGECVQYKVYNNVNKTMKNDAFQGTSNTDFTYYADGWTAAHSIMLRGFTVIENVPEEAGKGVYAPVKVAWTAHKRVIFRTWDSGIAAQSYYSTNDLAPVTGPLKEMNQELGEAQVITNI